MVGRVGRWLNHPIDATILDLFRSGLGLVLALAAARQVAYVWVDRLYLQPHYHFAWVSWAVVPSPAVLYALFGLMGATGLVLAASPFVGRWGARLYRPAVLLHLLAFGYVELLDKALYLNHYVLVTLLLVVLAVLPAPGQGMRRWGLWMLRAQFALVWFWAGFCKLNPDWLLRGEPLGSWLGARADLPVVGPLLALPATALLWSWGGALYDLSITGWLLWPRTRWAAAAVATAFHVVIWMLFPIGIFPWLMLLGVGLFFAGGPGPAPDPSPRLGRAGLTGWACALVVVGLVPARFAFLPGPVLWTEAGYRFAWRVMLTEKTGHVTYTAVDRHTGERWVLRPTAELEPWQHEQMRTQPDMIAQYGRHLADRLARQGHDVAIYADAWASMNGRRAQRLLRDDVDLTQPDAALWAQDWVVPLEDPLPW